MDLTTISTITVALITAVIGPIVVEWVRTKLKSSKETHTTVGEAVELGYVIDEKLDSMMAYLNCDRIWIAQFHNGGHFYPTGKSIAKFSVFYETVKVGIASIQNNFQNIPVNLFSKSVNELLENDIIEIHDFKDEKIPTFGLKYIAEESGCKSGYLFAIKSIDGKFIGTLGLDFTKKKTKLDIESINHLAVHASAMGGVLMTHLQK